MPGRPSNDGIVSFLLFRPKALSILASASGVEITTRRTHTAIHNKTRTVVVALHNT